MKKFAPWAHKKNGTRSPSLVCVVCDGAMPRSRAYTCMTCHHGCTEVLNDARTKIINAIAKQIRLGELKPAKECLCVDCGAAAHDYEHRDYTKPLDVVPVCRGCNKRRGPASGIQELIREHFGIAGSIGEFVAARRSVIDFESA